MPDREEPRLQTDPQANDRTGANAPQAAPGGEQPAHGSMGIRGVTRPMAERQFHQQNQQDAEPEPQRDTQHEGHGSSQRAMSHEQHRHMLHMHYQQTLWIYWLLILLGIWMVLAPVTFDYGIAIVQPSGGRQVWLPLSTRVAFMTWSDILSGVLLLVFGWRALTPGRPVSLWICCGVGVWLNMAPILLWAPTAVAYLNDTLIGVLVIALTILIPGMPNMVMYMEMGPQMPPGWSYNPSSWPQRWIMIVTGFAGWVVSRYLGAFQLGYIDQVWEPFFGDGTRQVLNSNMSHMWPISDAAFGAFAYTFEFLMGFMGSPSRWRTMPWMVTFFGILVIPLGLVHILLVISQPVMVGEWCTLCLLAAAIMLPMIPLEADEVVAMGQYLLQARRRGESFWKAFWKGGTVEGGGSDDRSPELLTLPQQPWTVFKASIWGMSFPWTLVASTGLGLWLMFVPSVLSSGKPMADIEHLGGALIVTVSVITMGEVLRVGRYLNVLLGLSVAGAAWLLEGGTAAGQINDLIVGLIVAALATPRGPKKERYGLWDPYVA
jgi:hypothetical protein